MGRSAQERCQLLPFDELFNFLQIDNVVLWEGAGPQQRWVHLRRPFVWSRRGCSHGSRSGTTDSYELKHSNLEVVGMVLTQESDTLPLISSAMQLGAYHTRFKLTGTCPMIPSELSRYQPKFRVQNVRPVCTSCTTRSAARTGACMQRESNDATNQSARSGIWQAQDQDETVQATCCFQMP